MGTHSEVASAPGASAHGPGDDVGFAEILGSPPTASPLLKLKDRAAASPPSKLKRAIFTVHTN